MFAVHGIGVIRLVKHCMILGKIPEYLGISMLGRARQRVVTALGSVFPQ